MRLTIECPQCFHVFEISENYKNKVDCKCGWKFNIQDHIECCLCVEQEGMDERRTKQHTSLEAAAADIIRIPYFIKGIWLERRFASIPEETVASFRSLMKSINFDKLALFKNFVSKHRVGVVKVFDKYVNVYIGKFRVANYDEESNSIYIPYGDLDANGKLNTVEISDQIQHEIGHATDKKLLSKTWRGVSDRYKELSKTPFQSLQDKASYVKEPAEFDAMGAHYDLVVKDAFNSEEYPENKQEILNNLEHWLKYDGDNLFPLDPQTLQLWRTKPTLYRKLKQKVWSLFQELKHIDKKLSANSNAPQT